MPTWVALILASVCAIALWARLAFLMPTWKLRRRVAVGLAVGAVVGLAQSFIKHTNQPWGLLLVADAYFALLVSLTGAGDAIREAALQSLSGPAQNVPQRVANRIVIIVLVASTALIIIESLTLKRS